MLRNEKIPVPWFSLLYAAHGRYFEVERVSNRRVLLERYRKFYTMMRHRALGLLLKTQSTIVKTKGPV